MSRDAIETIVPMTPTAAPASPIRVRRPRPRVPRHFFVGTLLLYGVVFGTFLLYRTSLHEALPNWRTVVPVAAGVSFYIAANLFLLILGRGHISRWTVLKVTGATLILTAVLCLSLRSQLIYERVGPDASPSLRGLIATIGGIIAALFARQGVLAQSAQFAGMIALEETVKLAAVFLLIRTGKIQNAHAAMLCGALSGLTFGTIEAISYGYLAYPAQAAPLTSYLTRFFVMSPLHGIWDSLAGGLVFFLSGRWRATASRRPGAGAFAAAFACAVVFHVAHNSLQIIVGKEMQIVSAFGLLGPMYVMAKHARRRAAAEGSPDSGQLLGDLHLLTISLATLFLAASIAFSWAMGMSIIAHAH